MAVQHGSTEQSPDPTGWYPTSALYPGSFPVLICFPHSSVTLGRLQALAVTCRTWVPVQTANVDVA